MSFLRTLKMRITKTTTKCGDKGETLLACKLVSKGHAAIELLGELDLLNVLIGNINNPEGTQDNIFELSAAVYKGEDWPAAYGETEYLEALIHELSQDLEPLKEFIRPSGDIHMARAQTRRCERLAWAYDSSKDYCRYLNRLSDYLFVLARVMSDEETQWER